MADNATHLYHAQVRCDRCEIDGNLMREDYSPRFGRMAQAVGLVFLLVAGVLAVSIVQSLSPNLPGKDWPVILTTGQVALGWFAAGVVLVGAQAVWACPKCGTTHTRISL